MAKKIKKGFGKIVKTLLKVLGITSILAACGETETTIIDGPVMYGTPTNVYAVSGIVKNNSGTAVEGIRVGIEKAPDDETRYNEWDFAELYVDEEGYSHWSDRYFVFTETDANGSYKLEWSLWPNDNAKFVLSAEDIDGEINGSFQNKSSEIQFTKNDCTKDGSWVDEYEKKNIDISLDEETSVE